MPARESRPLSASQAGVLRAFMVNRRASLPPPTFREIARANGWSSPATANEVVQSLADRGLVEAVKQIRARRWRLTTRGILIAESL